MSPSPNRPPRQSLGRENPEPVDDGGDDVGGTKTTDRRRRRSKSEGMVVRKKVGGYVLGDVLGEGSFAKVRLGTHILTQEQVAVKVIDKRLIASRDYVRKNLRREAVVLQKMKHTNIVRLYEVLETASNYYLVMELAEGGTFMSFLCRRRRLSERETRRYIRQLVAAVDHMHYADVIHRDIKIENFLLDADQNLKVIDFGLSNILGHDGLLRTQCGSPAYAAPEIFCNSSYGSSVDIWSIGVNMFAMLTGELPFVVDPPNNMSKLHARILQGAKLPDGLTPDCKDLLKKLLEPKEQGRIKLHDIMRHPWMNRGYSQRLYPSRIGDSPQSSAPVDHRIIKALVKCGHREDILLECVQENRPAPENAAYCLLAKRIAMGWGYPENSNDSGSAPDNDHSELTSVFTGMGGDDEMEVDSENPPDPIVALRRPISGRGTRSIAAKEKERLFDSRLKSDRVELESVLPNVGKKARPTSPTKREVQEDMKKAWSKIQTQPKNGENITINANGSADDAKNSINGSKTSSDGSDQNSNENKMDVCENDRMMLKQVRIIKDDKTATQLKKRVNMSIPAKPSTAPSFGTRGDPTNGRLRPTLQQNNTCIFIVNGKITAADQLTGRSAGRHAAMMGKRHSFAGGERFVYTKRGIERSKTMPAISHETGSSMSNGKEDQPTSETKTAAVVPSSSQIGDLSAPYQPHNAFPVHRLGSTHGFPTPNTRPVTRYRSANSSSTSASSTTNPRYQHHQYPGNRQQGFPPSRHQRSFTAPHHHQPQGPGDEHPILPPPPPQGTPADPPAKSVAWQDPPISSMLPASPSRHLRSRQRELPNIRGFNGYIK